MKSKLVAVLLTLVLVLGPGGALAQFMDLNSIISGIGSTRYLKDAGRVDGASSVRVVRLSSLAGAERMAERLATAESIKARDIDYLRANLANNPIAVTAIRNFGFTLDDIVSLTLAGDGSAVLFADDL
jgi:hypothetical protein